MDSRQSRWSAQRTVWGPRPVCRVPPGRISPREKHRAVLEGQGRRDWRPWCRKASQARNAQPFRLEDLDPQRRGSRGGRGPAQCQGLRGPGVPPLDPQVQAGEAGARWLGWMFATSEFGVCGGERGQRGVEGTPEFRSRHCLLLNVWDCGL